MTTETARSSAREPESSEKRLQAGKAWEASKGKTGCMDSLKKVFGAGTVFLDMSVQHLAHCGLCHNMDNDGMLKAREMRTDKVIWLASCFLADGGAEDMYCWVHYLFISLPLCQAGAL
ncbi:unnamed protein product [Caretta caretta]